MSVLILIASSAAAGAIGLLAHLALSSLVELPGRLLRGRRAFLAYRRREPPPARPWPQSEAALYGVANVRVWVLPYALLGMAVSSVLLSAGAPPLRAAGAVAGLLPFAYRRYRIARGRRETLRQVRSLLDALRLGLAFEVGLAPLLYRVAGEERPGLLFERLATLRDEILVNGPEPVLEQLAGDFFSAELRLLLRRVRAARLGGLGLSEALLAAADEVAHEVEVHVEQEIEGAPMRLLVGMAVLLLTPALVLTLYPLAAQLLRQLTGVGF